MKISLVRTAIRTVELSRPLQAITDLQDYSGVQIFVTLKDQLLGKIYISSSRKPISVSQLRDAIADKLIFKLLENGKTFNSDSAWANAIAALNTHFIPNTQTNIKLPPDVSASVVVATLDRPDELRECLHCLQKQVTSRTVEIVAVDNNPDSGLTPPVVTEFPEVKLVQEYRKGLSYARNKGIIHCTGDIVIAIDDDVVMPSTWLEKLLAPFVRNDVMIVTGNVLPFQLETQAQQLFEVYGGLGKGYEKFEADHDWFDKFRYKAVPTWQLGATANAAFRAKIFSDSQIGLLDEALGAGTPTGCSEDTYLFYKTIKAGYTLVYEPEAYVWHKHRRDMSSLRRQLYNYSKGHVAYHLTTLIHDHDLRALVRLALELPFIHLWRMKESLRGRSSYPAKLILLEIIGNLAGPFALWKSYQRVKREGRSEPYVPVS